MTDLTTAWINALAFLAGYGAAELQHRIRCSRPPHHAHVDLPRQWAGSAST